MAVNNAKSKPKTLEHGVPQGSLLGPLFYIMYTKQIEEIAKKFNIKINVYADDIQLYTSFHLSDYGKIKQKITQCLSEIKRWMDENF